MQSRSSKTEYQDAFIKAAFIRTVLDKTNTDAGNMMQHCRRNLDPKWCDLVLKQVDDVKLRHRWMASRVAGRKLPKVNPSVQRHFESEYQRAYPVETVIDNHLSAKGVC